MCRQRFVKTVHKPICIAVHVFTGCPVLRLGHAAPAHYACTTLTSMWSHTALVNCCFNQSAPNVFVRQSQGRIISKITADTGLQGSLFITLVTSPEAQLWFVSALLKGIRARPSTLATLAQCNKHYSNSACVAMLKGDCAAAGGVGQPSRLFASRHMPKASYGVQKVALRVSAWRLPWLLPLCALCTFGIRITDCVASTSLRDHRCVVNARYMASPYSSAWAFLCRLRQRTRSKSSVQG